MPERRSFGSRNRRLAAAVFGGVPCGRVYGMPASERRSHIRWLCAATSSTATRRFTGGRAGSRRGVDDLAEAAQASGAVLREARDACQEVLRWKMGLGEDLVDRASRAPAIVPVGGQRVLADDPVVG